MKVWVVWGVESGYGTQDFRGVFSTQGIAEEQRDKLSFKNKEYVYYVAERGLDDNCI